MYEVVSWAIVNYMYIAPERRRIEREEEEKKKKKPSKQPGSHDYEGLLALMVKCGAEVPGMLGPEGARPI